jgi:hypothetical protein
MASVLYCLIVQAVFYLVLIKRNLFLKINKNGCAKSMIGDLYNIFRYKSLRSYSAFKGKESVNCPPK